MKILKFGIFVFCIFAMATVGVYAEEPASGARQEETAALAPASTLDNLTTAFNGESNAHARYVAFAEKADEEGYAAVASLFRAAAEAEKIHAKKHASVIEKMTGSAPLADLKTPDVKTTRENLETALAGETYERDTMYPEFIMKAQGDNQEAAVRTFGFAKAAEAKHAELYQQALDNLEQWKVKSNFYVCPVCGYTEAVKDEENCPVCFTPASQFLVIS